MSFRGDLHVELWPLEVDGGTGGTQHLSTFAILVTVCSTKIAVTKTGHCYLIRMLSYRKCKPILKGGTGERHPEKPVDKKGS